jgi:serine/threonine protein kinase
LGQGGSSEVFSAKAPFGELVAVKIQRRPRKRPRFMQEYHILNKNLHPSLIQVYEFGLLPQGWAYLILELIKGKSATTHVRSFYGKERLQQSIIMAAQVSRAFGALHNIGWIHGDIKSKNILVDQKQLPHLIDFELSRPLEETGKRKFFGTRSYAPPEQHQGKKLTTSVDVYAMAGVLYRCITNKLPYASVEKEQQVKERMKPPNISKRLPSDLRDLLMAALDSKPENRPQDGTIFAEELLRCLAKTHSPIQIHPLAPPSIFHVQTVLKQNKLPPEKHILDIISISGDDPNLISRFAYHKVSNQEWVPKEYKRQIWYYLRQLPPEIQDALYLLASVGGMATMSNIQKFTGSSKSFIEDWFQNFPHLIRKEGSQWHLFVGATHEVCQYLVPQEDEGFPRLEQVYKHFPRWAKMFIDSLQDPASILTPFQNWIFSASNTLFQWRLLRRLQEYGYALPMLELLLLYRRNGDWLHALEVQRTAPAEELLTIYYNLSEDNIDQLLPLTKNKNIDVQVCSKAILAEWHILHADFILAEKYIIDLCKYTDSYPRLIGLQQRALLYHHLGQFTQLDKTYQALEKIVTYPMTNKIKKLISQDQWDSNLIPLEKVNSRYMQAIRKVRSGEDPFEEIKSLMPNISIANQAFLSVHPNWYSFTSLFSLMPQPTDEEFRYPFESEEEY